MIKYVQEWKKIESARKKSDTWNDFEYVVIVKGTCTCMMAKIWKWKFENKKEINQEKFKRSNCWVETCNGTKWSGM